jgi:glycerate 2-kinase
MSSSDRRTARVLICPDKFKGSATAFEVGTAVRSGLRAAGVTESTVLPLADGGDGTLTVLLEHAGVAPRRDTVTGPHGRPVDAQWGLLPDGTAIIEMAQASGLALMGSSLDPIGATTRGTGELMLLAARAGATRCIVAVGGSATTDGGLGALDALEWSLHGMDVVVATDVTTLFVDAATVFGPQKGADAAQVSVLTARLEALADRFVDERGVNVRTVPGSGAAGGLAGGLFALGASIVGGFEMVANQVGLDDALMVCTQVITGEGRLDATSFVGKPVGEVTLLATRLGIPLHVVCGAAELITDDRFASVHQLIDEAPSVDEAIRNPLPYLERIGEQIGTKIRDGLSP